MSEHFTHIAVFEDSARLFLNAPDICESFKTAIHNHYDCGLLGSASRGNHLFAVPIIEQLKTNWDELKDLEESQIKMAFAIGWVTHRASDLQMKPVLKKNDEDPDPRYNGYINSIYHDANSFKKVYESGTMPSLSKNEVLSPATFAYDMQSHPAAKAVNVRITEPLFSWTWQQDMMCMQTFLNKEENFEKWLDTFVSRWPDFSENFQDYEKAHNDPNPFLEKKYYEIDHLYNETDDIILFVRTIQHGKKPLTDLETVLEKAKNQSQYAQALRRGYYFVKGINDYFTGKIDKAAAYEIIEMNEQFKF